jgi:predicted O-linked N-acetylglucosamine transferase (SPINDLY family)
LETLRAKVCAQRETSPLFKTALFTRHLERGYEQAYERYFSGQVPAEIVVRG